jgi:hypothetical protein
MGASPAVPEFESYRRHSGARHPGMTIPLDVSGFMESMV